MQLLADNFVTPNDIYFVRNHLPVPDIDEKNYELEITGEGLKTIKLSLEVSKTINRFPLYEQFVFLALKAAPERTFCRKCQME